MTSPALTANSTRSRILNIDLLRGIIMIIMALDHVRDFFHHQALTGNPLNPDTTTAELYATRWITHFCAPVFVFLSGMSAWLQRGRKSNRELGGFLVTRGIWLILIDLLIMSFVFTADIYYSVFVLETLWAIGASMIVLGLLIYLPFRVILAIGLIIFLGHNLLDFLEKDRASLPVWWQLLHRQGFVRLWDNHNLLILYPFLSWTGLMLLGYCCGKLFTDYPAAKRKKVLLTLGIALVALFMILRILNIYGDPAPWTERDSGLKTFFAFMNVQKYPPSLQFLCITIGPALVFLALVQNTRSAFSRFAMVFGRVPLFYFVVHFFIAHLVQFIIYLAKGHSFAAGMKGDPRSPFKFMIPGEGFSLAVVYGAWIALVLLMYPICKAYDRYKQANKHKKWLSYL